MAKLEDEVKDKAALEERLAKAEELLREKDEKIKTLEQEKWWLDEFNKEIFAQLPGAWESVASARLIDGGDEGSASRAVAWSERRADVDAVTDGGARWSKRDQAIESSDTTRLKSSEASLVPGPKKLKKIENIVEWSEKNFTDSELREWVEDSFKARDSQCGLVDFSENEIINPWVLLEALALRNVVPKCISLKNNKINDTG